MLRDQDLQSLIQKIDSAVNAEEVFYLSHVYIYTFTYLSLSERLGQCVANCTVISIFMLLVLVFLV